MARKAEWAKSTNGPDWTDIEAMLRSIEGLHGGAVVLSVSTVGIGASGGLALSAVHSLETLAENATHSGVGVDALWPSKDCATMEGLWYQLLWRLDFAIGENYQQQKIPA